MNTQQTPEISVSVTTLDQLFNDPAINPFSKNEIEVRGESGMSYVLRQLQSHRRDERDLRLTLRLPPDQLKENSQREISQAVRRYCQARIEGNALDIHLIRVRSSTGLGILAAIVVVLSAVAYLFFTRVAPDTPQAIQAIAAATLCLVAWVVLWDPLEALIFNPIAPIRENRQLRKIMQLNIKIEPDTSMTTISDAHLPNPDARTLASGA